MSTAAPPPPGDFQEPLQQVLALLFSGKKAGTDWLTASEISSSLLKNHGLSLHWKTVETILSDNPKFAARRKKNKKWQFTITNPGQELVSSGNNLGIRGVGQNTINPRFGFAWSLPGTDRIVLRGGYGVYHQRATGQPYLQQVANQPFGLLRVVNPVVFPATSVSHDVFHSGFAQQSLLLMLWPAPPPARKCH